MAASPEDPTIVDVPGESRFVVDADGAKAELSYRREGNRLILVHTAVPDQLSGRGIGGQLAQAAIEQAAKEGLTLVPWCPFVRRWLQDHLEVAATVEIDWSWRPRGE